jgi:hypothetical protein
VAGKTLIDQVTMVAWDSGGSAEIVLTGNEHGAGCLVFVRDGRLLMFDGYIYVGEWREAAQVVEIKCVTPIDPAKG